MQVNFLGAIFDADGVLIDSMKIWHNLGEYYLRSKNIIPEENLSARLWLMSFDEGCEYLKNNYLDSMSVSEVKDGIMEMIRDFYFHEVKIKSGIKQFLDELSQKNIPLVIATSGDKDLLTAALKRNNIFQYFTKIFTCSELNTNKRENKIFLECAEFLGIKNENIAVFEDSLFALKTAKNSGFITFGVFDEESINDIDKIKKISDYYINNWSELIDENSIDNSRQ